jgi:hypothetical protein
MSVENIFDSLSINDYGYTSDYFPNNKEFKLTFNTNIDLNYIILP